MALGARQLRSSANWTGWTDEPSKSTFEVAVPTNGQAEVMPIRSGLGIFWALSQQQWLESWKPLWTSLGCKTVRIGWRRLLQAGGFLQHLAASGRIKFGSWIALYQVVNQKFSAQYMLPTKSIQILVLSLDLSIFRAMKGLQLTLVQPSGTLAEGGCAMARRVEPSRDGPAALSATALCFSHFLGLKMGKGC